MLGPGAPGVRASRWDGDGVPDLDSGDWDLSICSEVKPNQAGRSQAKNMNEDEGDRAIPAKDPWPSPGSDCEGSGWTGPLRPLKSQGSPSSGQELGLSHFRVGSEEDCPRES